MNATNFFSGIALATFGASGLFFLKFWKASRDQFFLLFCVACWALALERAALFFVRGAQESADEMVGDGSWVYLFRLIAFLLILIAVLNKNRRLS